MSSPTWAPPCPVCGTPAAPAPAACPTCGLPAVTQAATVVARLEATIDEFARERDALVATLRGVARTAPARPARVPVVARVGAPTPAPPPPPGPFPPAPPTHPPPAAAPPASPPPAAPPPASPPPASGASPAGPPPAPRRRLSPQQVLLGLGALLVVAAAIAFVAVAWTRLGVSFQAAVMATVTAAACGTSAVAARRGLRATEEALAAAGAALLAVDLGAAHGLGLLGADCVPLQLWTGLSCVAVVLAALALGRATRSTVTWPLVALLAAQPAGWLLLPADLADGAAGVTVLAATALADVLAVRWLRRTLAPAALALALLVAIPTVLLGLLLAWVGPPLDSWLTTAVLGAAGAAALALPRVAARADARPPAAAAAAVAAAALAGSLSGAGAPGGVVAAALGLALLSAATPARVAGQPLTALAAAGAVLAAAGAAVVADAERYGTLAALVLAAAVPAVLAAVLRPPLRAAATAAALAAAGLAVLTAREGGLLDVGATGLLLAIVGATAFGVATLRAGRPEEVAAAASGTLAGAVAGLVTGGAGAWGQVAVDLVVVGAAAGCYALVTGRRPVAALAVADLVLAGWIAAAGADIRTPEVYTLPAALGLAVFAVPALRAGTASWAAEGPAVAVALLPSALVAVAEPTALRLVGVVAAATALTVAGTLAHRQAPFVLGAGALAVVVLGRLAPYAPLVPRWVTLTTAGLVLLVVGATYERRRQQAREAVAWVAQMH